QRRVSTRQHRHNNCHRVTSPALALQRIQHERSLLCIVSLKIDDILIQQKEGDANGLNRITSVLRMALATAILLSLFPTTHSQAIRNDQSKVRSSMRAPMPANHQIQRIVREIDPRNIEHTIRKLVSFGTRNTLSEQNNPNRGIGAARDWLYDEFQKVAQQSNGRMSVEKQSFEQARAQRVPEPTVLTNIVATLKGTQPESEHRLYVVSGHYDSMCSSPTDAKCDAPGANDDASGTATVLEMARVMAKEKFDATIVFMTVAGEEQG